MNNFFTALTAEHIKKKGTGIYWLAVVIGAFMPIAYSISMIVQNDTSHNNADVIPYNYFIKIIEEMGDGFTNFFFPLLIIITVSRITQLDHKNGGWQLMETQPISKWSVYFSKFSVIIISNLIAITTLVVCSYAFGGLMLLFLDAPKAATFGLDILPVLDIMLRLLLASLFFTALQYLISVIIPSFIWSVLIGFFMLLGYLFLNLFNVLPPWYPIIILAQVSTHIQGSELGYVITYNEVASVLIAIAVVYVGFNWYRHKSLKRAFAGNSKRAVAVVAVIALFGGLTFYTFRPNTYAPYGKTIVSGKVESTEHLQFLYLQDQFIHDTIAVIPIKNNEFHYEIKKEIPLDTYRFLFDNGVNGNLVFSGKDSVYLLLKKNKSAVEGKITGSRLAENQYKEEKKNSYSYVSMIVNGTDQLNDVAFFSNQLIDEWKDAIKETNKFKTADNYVPREDFISYNKKLLTITYLNYWQDFVKKRKAMFPKEKTAESPEIAAMKKTVPLDNEGLLSDESYFTYVSSQLISKNEEDIDENTKAIRAIAQLKAGTFKDKMLYWQLQSSLREAASKSERDSLAARYAYTFKDKKYSKLALNIQKTLDNIDKGKPAPAIAGTTIEGKPFSLEQYKGKYIAIDVWATWCAPCREESPKFEKMALKYKAYPIQFIAISTDQKMDTWFVQAKFKSKSVLQVHADNEKLFSDMYDIEYIPRFILIDREGKLVNAKMPRPSETSFEEVLRHNLGLGDQK